MKVFIGPTRFLETQLFRFHEAFSKGKLTKSRKKGSRAKKVKVKPYEV
jgi:hypothetical protein